VAGESLPLKMAFKAEQFPVRPLPEYQHLRSQQQQQPSHEQASPAPDVDAANAFNFNTAFTDLF
jgi:hypothetical protein